MDRFGVAAPDLAGQNAFAGVMADVGIEQIGSSPLQRPDLGDPRERCHDGLDAGNLRIGEPARLPRRPGCNVNRAVSEGQRGGEVIGRTLRAQLAVYRKFLGIVPITQLAPNDAAGFDDGEERAVLESISFQEFK